MSFKRRGSAPLDKHFKAVSRELWWLSCFVRRHVFEKRDLKFILIVKLAGRLRVGELSIILGFCFVRDGLYLFYRER